MTIKTMRFWNRSNRSPYLENEGRLSDVIAAIQVLGTYKYYSNDFTTWADRISADESRADYWRKIFEQHPEFFRMNTKKTKAALVLRRQRGKRYNVDSGEILSKAQYDSLEKNGKERVSREPLIPDQIEALIGVAINLHARAAEQMRDRRWWIPPLLAFAGALLGAILSGAFKDAPEPRLIPVKSGAAEPRIPS